MNDRVTVTCIAVLIGLLLLEVFAVDMKPAVAWERIPGHMEIIGFVSHMLVVFGCKWLGKNFLQRPANYDD